MESELEEKGEKIKKDFLVTQNSIDRLQGMSTEKKKFWRSIFLNPWLFQRKLL